MKRDKVEMAARLLEKLRVDSEAPDRGHAETEEGDAPPSPPPSHAKMATPPDAPPGIEFDSKGHVIPVAKRTKTHRDEAEQSE